MPVFFMALSVVEGVLFSALDFARSLYRPFDYAQDETKRKQG